MGKKLKKDFKERHKASLEREMFHSKTDTIPEESKLKHNDDYRGKIVHDKERFQDKFYEKQGKISVDNENYQGASKSKARYKSSVNETGKADYVTEVKDGKIYDPLGKDLDNDGIIDRYDNDFRDSDYFESTYDVPDNFHQKEKPSGNTSKKSKAQKNIYKRKNYSESQYTRKKDDDSKADKSEKIKSGKDAIYDREKKNMISKESRKAFALSGLAKGSEVARNYLSHGSDENQGVEAGEKMADASSKLMHGIKNAT